MIMNELPSMLKDVVTEHGQDMVALIMSSGLAGEAAARLSEVLQRQHSTHGLAALKVLINSFNAVSNAYVKEKGWTQEQLAAAELAIKMAVSQQVVIPESKIILAS
jgi:malate/lactate dehydrogenase